MAEYFASIFIAGSLLILASTVLMIISARKPDHLENILEHKRNEVVAVINDAEQMLEELNKFSEYIVTQMDFKSEELRNNLRFFEQRVNEITTEKKAAMETANSQKGSEQSKNNPVVSEREKVIPLDARYREVLKLANEGMSDLEIAKRLKMGKGEIQLVLDINK